MGSGDSGSQNLPHGWQESDTWHQVFSLLWSVWSFQHQHEQSSDGHRCMPSGQHALLLPNRRCISFHAFGSWACQPDMSTIPISLSHTHPSYPGLIYSLLVLLFLPFRHSPPLRVQYKVRGKQNTVNRRSESQKVGTKKKCHSLVLFRQVSRKDMGQW